MALDVEMLVSWLVVFLISHEKCDAVCFFFSPSFLCNHVGDSYVSNMNSRKKKCLIYDSLFVDAGNLGQPTFM